MKIPLINSQSDAILQKPAENLEVTSASVVTGAAQPELSVAADASSEVTELATEAKQEVPLNNNESETEAKPQGDFLKMFQNLVHFFLNPVNCTKISSY